MAITHLRRGVVRTHRYRTRAAAHTRTPGTNAAAPGHTRIEPLEAIVKPSRFETLPQLDATSVMPSGRNVSASGGMVQYEAIIRAQRAGVTAVITPSMLRTGSSARYEFPFISRRTGLIIVRGHLLAKVLGGDGSDPRNLVPLYHARNNLPMYRHFEHLVKRRVERGDAVRVTIRPHYPATSLRLSAFPDYITYTARDAKSGASVLPGTFSRFYTGFHP